MAISDERPKYLNLIKIRLPVPGIVSIAHRISGVLMFLAIPALVYLFHLSALSDGGFELVSDLFAHFGFKLTVLLLGWSLFHHLFAGIRYLLIDMDIGVDKSSARAGAFIAMIAGVVSAIVILVVLL